MVGCWFPIFSANSIIFSTCAHWWFRVWFVAWLCPSCYVRGLRRALGDSPPPCSDMGWAGAPPLRVNIMLPMLDVRRPHGASLPAVLLLSATALGAVWLGASCWVAWVVWLPGRWRLPRQLWAVAAWRWGLGCGGALYMSFSLCWVPHLDLLTSFSLVEQHATWLFCSHPFCTRYLLFFTIHLTYLLFTIFCFPFFLSILLPLCLFFPCFFISPLSYLYYTF